MAPQYLIWSIEHDAWWRPGWHGYTRVLAEAGRYDAAEAERILDRTNTVGVNECKIPLACFVGTIEPIVCYECGATIVDRTSAHRPGCPVPELIALALARPDDAD